MKCLFVTLIIAELQHYAERRYSRCHFKFIIMLNAIMLIYVMLNVIMLSYVMQNFIMLSIVAHDIQRVKHVQWNLHGSLF
jgi:hypothetical protein